MKPAEGGFLFPASREAEAWWDFKEHRRQHRLLREIEKTCEEVWPLAARDDWDGKSDPL